MFVFLFDVYVKECACREAFAALLALEDKVAWRGVTQFKVTPNLRHRSPIFCVIFDVAGRRVHTVRMAAVITTIFSEKRRK
jgi:hypothetical protein